MLNTTYGFFKEFLTSGHERSIKAKKNILGSFIIKGLSILISLLLVPLTIHYVNPTRYGIWLTLSSIIGWFSFFDIGFGNGLRNKFAEAIAKGNIELARIYVSTTYAILSIIIGIVLVLFLIINPLMNWAKILNTPSALANELSLLALVVFAFFCIQFLLQLLTTIITADQKPAKASLLNLLGNILSLIIIFILTKITSGSLLYLGLAMSAAPVIIFLGSSYWLYTRDYKEFAPSFKYVKFNYASDLMYLGLKFFIIQISTIVLFQTSNIILTQILGPESVTIYNISFKYFSVSMMLFNIIMIPFWSAFTEAYAKKDFNWIENTVKKLIFIWGINTIMIFIMLGISSQIYRIWIGEKLIIPFSLSLANCIYVIIITWSTIFVNFLNGVSKIFIQLIISVSVAFINIPLSIILLKYTSLGIAGIVYANSFCILIGAIIGPVQYKKILNKIEKGIWNR